MVSWQGSGVHASTVGKLVAFSPYLERSRFTVVPTLLRVGSDRAEWLTALSFDLLTSL